jgi:SAM-dependent methyltransferase
MLKFFNKHLYLKLLFFALLTIRNVIRSNIFQLNLKTGDRKINSSNTLKYLKFCTDKITPHFIDIKNINNALEIGPGDNNGLALSLLYEGIDSIDLIDRYQNNINEDDNIEIYKKISKNYGKNFNPIEYNLKIKRLKSRSGLLSLSKIVNPTKYDLIYSVSVLEHLWPFEKNLKAMVNLCNKGGILISLVNFTDHSMFSPKFNRFYFRKIPKFIYDPIMSPGGRPNRILPSQIEKFLIKENFDVSIHVMRTHTRVIETGEKFSKASVPTRELNELYEIYGEIEDQNERICDLAIGSAVIVAKKN